MTDIRILIVEDEEVVANGLKDRLETLGYKVCGIANSGEDALQEVAKTPPDLVLMDIRLPGEIDGVEAAQELRTHNDVPVIFLTGYDDEYTLERAKITEPFGFILKPFEITNLHSTIQLALYKHTTEKKLRDNEERYRSVVENSHIGIVTINEDFQLTYVNDRLCQILDQPRKEIIGEDFRRFLDENSRPIFEEHFNTRQLGEQPSLHFEINIVRSDSEKRCVEMSAAVVKDQTGIIHTVGQLLDITERKQAELELREHQEHLEELVEARTADLSQANEQLRYEIEERANAEMKLQRRTEQLHTLNTFSHQVSASLSMSQVVESALKGIADHIAPDLALLFLCQDDDLMLTGVYPKELSSQEKCSSPRVGKCLCGLAASQGKPIFSSDINTDPRYCLEKCKQAGMRSFAALPMRSGENVLGVLGVASTEERDFTELSAFLEALSGEISISVQNAQLYEQAQQEIMDREKAEQALAERVTELNAIHHITNAMSSKLETKALLQFIVDQACALLKTPTCAIVLPAEDSGEMICQAGTQRLTGVRIPAGQGIVGRTYRLGASQIVLDTSKDPDNYPLSEEQDRVTQSMLASPLVVEDQPIGVLAMGSERKMAFTEQDLALLETVASHAAIAIYNARLFEQAQAEIAERGHAEARAEHLLNQQVSINHLSLALGQTRDLNIIYRTIYEHIKSLMDTVAFVVSFFDPETRLIHASFLANGGILPDASALPPIPLAEDGTGPQSRVIINGEPLYVPDFRKAVEKHRTVYTVKDDGTIVEGLPTENATEEYVKSILYAPMKIAGETIGVMQVQSKRLDAYSQEDLDLVAGLANVAAIAINNARLFEQLEAELEVRRQTEEKLREHREQLEELIQERTQELHQVNKNLRNEIEERRRAETLLKASEARYRSLVETSPEAITLTNLEGEIVLCNQRTAKLHGFERPEDIIGNNTFDFVAPEERSQAFKSLEQVLTEKTIENLPYTLLRQDGSRFFGELSFSVIIDEEGQPSAIIEMTRDISERKQAEQALIASERRYRQVVEFSPLIIVTQTGDKIDFINPIGAKILGAEHPDEVIGKSLIDFVHPDHRQAMYERFYQLLQADSITPFMEERIIRHDGTIMDLEISAILTGGSEMPSIQVIAFDVSERRLAQETLKRQAALAEIELAINQPHELQAVLDQIVEITTQLLPASGGASIALWDEHTDNFWTGSSTLPSTDKQLIDRLMRKQNGVTRWIIKNQQAVVSPDITQDRFDTSPLLTKHGYQAYVGIPLMMEEEAQGVLFVWDRHPRNYSGEDLDFLNALANRAALAIAKVSLYETLQKAKEVAEETSRAKAEFLANVSHELRTPLTAVISLAELLQETELDLMQKGFVNTINLSAEKLLDLIDDILDFSKIEAEELTLESVPFDLRNCIESSLDIVAMGISSKELELAYSVDNEIPQTILGDPTRLGQILTNLLSNAVKFTEAGEIFLHASIRQTEHDSNQYETSGTQRLELVFAVTDTGIGIPKDRIPFLFKAFSQLDASTARKYGGTGLGLAISKQIVQLMGGEIWVESSGIPGEGSTFYFTIQTEPVIAPIHPYMRKYQPALKDKQALVVIHNQMIRRVLEEQLQYWGIHPHIFSTFANARAWLQNNGLPDLLIFSTRSAEEDARSLSEEINQQAESGTIPLIVFTSIEKPHVMDWDVEIAGFLHSPIKPSELYDLILKGIGQELDASRDIKLLTRERSMDILVVEDDPTIQKVIAFRLERLGYNAKVANNGQEALEALEQKHYQIILMDLQMPEMDGLSTTRYIREAIPVDRQPFIIALTADARKETHLMMIKEGVDLYLTKPINGETLEKALLRARDELPSSEGHTLSPELTSQTGSVVPSPIDETVLADFIDAVGEDANEALAEVLDSFFENTPKLMADLKVAAAEEDWAQLKWTAHALKGNCELLGATSLAQMCKKLENDLKDNAVSNAIRRADQIEVEFSKVIEALEIRRSQL